MSNELSTIATYAMYTQAEVARIALASAGIAGYIQDSNLATMIGIGANAIGWIKLQVPVAVAAEARALLEASPGLLWDNRPKPEPLSDDACLSCGQVIQAGADRCVACGWSFLDEPLPEAEAVEEEESDEN